VKKELLKLLQSAGVIGVGLDDLVEDILALTIKYALPTPTMAAPSQAATAEEIEHAVEDVYVDVFGAQLHNLYTMQDYPGKRKLYHSARCAVVKAMIRAMLLTSEEHFDRTALHSGSRVASESAAIQ
jgi:hypothetical protein